MSNSKQILAMLNSKADGDEEMFPDFSTFWGKQSIWVA